ncbi:uncharacterized protein SPPG_03183 [Spizellomyces punctatus DAOM BR117]|uniref:Uncharacterized protein n=1 Tax=Spizellomyces punctatus (strain DAOM BR117) TaxID=645134 RepID=A0A0L0HKE9_SPIPD|nr:uncharacterized protein SPPG_03183 [Spizellomyces punctatus DAOM BR117]KND01370.1 hypothetical protein SPPG_03183 [Spizellomyces punctatus DAOM BR117]|eukprot:XP_016609409.1 hypothetical protein SPPG_03183 [Spizellomyces punctatus DAOM BR117]
MAVSSGSQDTLYFLILFLVFSLGLLAFTIRLCYHGTSNILMKTLILQSILTVGYFVDRLAIVIYSGDPTCGILTVGNGLVIWYSSLGIFYLIQSQKARALCQSLFPQVNKHVFTAMQVGVMLVWCIHVIIVALRSHIRSCTVVYEGLVADFACAIVIQTYLLIQDIVILFKLKQGWARINTRWSTMQLDLLKESTLMMIFLVSSNIYVYYIYIPTVAYIIWYMQIFLFCYLSYSTLQNIHATKDLVLSDLSSGQRRSIRPEEEIHIAKPNGNILRVGVPPIVPQRIQNTTEHSSLEEV